jgi:hypothetical protein
MMVANVYDSTKLAQLKSWGYSVGTKPAKPRKEAFTEPGGAMPPMDPAAMGGMPQGMPADPAAMGGMPMDPAMMGAVPPGMPMDPAAMGGMPMDPAMMGGMPPGAPPVDPMMANQEAIRSIIREEIQKAVGAGAGEAAGAAKKGGNKFDEALSVLQDKMEHQTKILVAALRNAGIEIPLADLYGLEKAKDAEPSGESPQGVSELLNPGMSGGSGAEQQGKLASALSEDEREVEALRSLCRARDSVKRAALAPKLVRYDAQAPELDYFAGLFR